MKKSDMRIVMVCISAFLLLSGCSKDGDGKLEMKEPKKELSEMPKRKSWFDTPISQQPTDETQK